MTHLAHVLALWPEPLNWLQKTWWPETGQGYAFFSGPLGDIAILGIFGVLYRRLKCHAAGCYRLGLHHVAGTAYVTCRKHHPTVPNGRVDWRQIHEAHAEATKTDVT